MPNFSLSNRTMHAVTKTIRTGNVPLSSTKTSLRKQNLFQRSLSMSIKTVLKCKKDILASFQSIDKAKCASVSSLPHLQLTLDKAPYGSNRLNYYSKLLQMTMSMQRLSQQISMTDLTQKLSQFSRMPTESVRISSSLAKKPYAQSTKSKKVKECLIEQQTMFG